jgi:hypothetical protein
MDDDRCKLVAYRGSLQDKAIFRSGSGHQLEHRFQKKLVVADIELRPQSRGRKKRWVRTDAAIAMVKQIPITGLHTRGAFQGDYAAAKHPLYVFTSAEHIR